MFFEQRSYFFLCIACQSTAYFCNKELSIWTSPCKIKEYIHILLYFSNREGLKSLILSGNSKCTSHSSKSPAPRSPKLFIGQFCSSSSMLACLITTEYKAFI